MRNILCSDTAVIKMKLSTVELVILGFSTVLQLVCLVAPGWWIQTNKYEGSTSYEALFYVIICAKSLCKTMSWRAYWEDRTDDYFYDCKVRQQIFLIVAMAATVLCLAPHIVKRRRQTVSSLLVAITTCSCMAGSGALMIWNLSEYYILIHAIHDPDVIDSFGFPYCVMLYSLAFLGNATVFILSVIEVVREHRRLISQDILSEPRGPSTTNTVNTDAGAYSRFS